MPGLPLESYTPGQALINYRELQFGAFTFALTMQEQIRASKIKLDRQIVAFSTGDYVSPQTNVGAREVTFVGAMGTGLVNSAGVTMVSATDLENERAILANLQSLGRQKLWVRSDRYCLAFMESFEHRFFQDGGVFRFADWIIKFLADDPRYFSTIVHTSTDATRTDTAQYTYGGGGITHTGSTRAFPIVTFTGKCAAPLLQMTYGTGIAMSVKFSGLTMNAGDTLVIDTDPRPEHRTNCAIYTPIGGAATSALKYIAPASDIANNYDTRFFFPFLEPQSANNGQLLQYSVGGAAPSYSVTVSFNDTWL